MQIEIVVLYGPPEPLGKNVVRGSTRAIHADAYALGIEGVGKFIAGELSALIGIKKRIAMGRAYPDTTAYLQAQDQEAFSRTRRCRAVFLQKAES